MCFRRAVASSGSTSSLGWGMCIVGFCYSRRLWQNSGRDSFSLLILLLFPEVCRQGYSSMRLQLALALLFFIVTTYI